MQPSRDVGRLIENHGVLVSARTRGGLDIEQTFETFVSYTIEEAYEFAGKRKEGEMNGGGCREDEANTVQDTGWRIWVASKSIAQAQYQSRAAACLYVAYSVLASILAAVTMDAATRFIAILPLVALIVDLAIALGIYVQYRVVAVGAVLLLLVRSLLIPFVSARALEIIVRIMIELLGWISVAAAVRGAFGIHKFERSGAETKPPPQVALAGADYAPPSGGNPLAAIPMPLQPVTSETRGPNNLAIFIVAFLGCSIILAVMIGILSVIIGGIRVGSSDALVAAGAKAPCDKSTAFRCLRSEATYLRECRYLSITGVSTKTIVSPDGRFLPPCPLLPPY